MTLSGDKIKQEKNGYGKPLKAFTLVEILIVIAIIITITAATLNGIVNSQKLFAFNAASTKIIDMVREARSYAITGKAQPDFTDYDGNGCYDANHSGNPPGCPVGGDYVTPANYGVYFGSDKIDLFADIHQAKTTSGGTADPNTEGKFLPGSNDIGQRSDGTDLVLSEYQIPNGITLKVNVDGVSNPSFSCGVSGACTPSIFYSPIFADFNTDPSPTSQSIGFVYIGVSDGERSSCFKIQKLAGNPEVEADQTKCQ